MWSILLSNQNPKWPWQDSNLQSLVPKTNALSIRPQGHSKSFQNWFQVGLTWSFSGLNDFASWAAQPGVYPFLFLPARPLCWQKYWFFAPPSHWTKVTSFHLSDQVLRQAEINQLLKSGKLVSDDIPTLPPTPSNFTPLMIKRFSGGSAHLHGWIGGKTEIDSYYLSHMVASFNPSISTKKWLTKWTHWGLNPGPPAC